MGKGGKGKGAPPLPSTDRAAIALPKKHWREELEEKARCQKAKVGVNVCKLPAGPLDRPRWETAFAAQASDEGSDGVVFVATKAGGYVIKASAKPAEEYFATRVLRRLGVRAPDVRVVCHVDAEWRAVKRAVRTGAECAERRGDIIGAAKLRQRLDGPLNRAQLLIMSLIPCAGPVEGNPHAADFFRIVSGEIRDQTADGLGCRPSCAEVSAELHMLGRCLAADVLLNNCDRFRAPCWDNVGNGGNLLLATESSSGANKTTGCDSPSSLPSLRVVAIDSVGTCLSTDSPMFQKYLGRARDFLSAVCEDDSTVEALQQLNIFLCNNCGVRLNAEALHEVRRGVLQVLTDVASTRKSNSGELNGYADAVAFADWVEALQKQVQSHTISTDWMNVWGRSAALIDSSFLHQMVTMFQEVAFKYQTALPEPMPISEGGPSSWKSVANLLPDAACDTIDMSSKLLDMLPAEIQDEMLDAQEKPFKMLILQHSSRMQEAGACLVDEALSKDKAASGQMAGLVVLPEGFVREKLQSDISLHLADEKGNPPAGSLEAPVELKAYAEVAKKHGVYIVCGSMYEPKPTSPPQFHITSIVLGPNGCSVGAYRKRRIHNHTVQLSGDRPLVFRVPGLGKVAVLICLDAEDSCLRDEVISLGARCVLNPVHIPEQDGKQSQWQVALDAMAENFTYVCHTHGITWVRCDLPYPHGMGSSQVIGSEHTHRVASMHSEVMPVLILPPPSSSGNIPLLGNVPGNSQDRQRKEQNCGARCTVSSVVLKGQIVAMRFYNRADSQGNATKKIIATFADEAMAIIGVCPAAYVEKTAVAGTPLHAGMHSEIAKGDVVTERPASIEPLATTGEWLDNEGKYFLGITSSGDLELCKRGSDGNLRRPLVIPTAERIILICADRRDGCFATLSTSNSTSKVSFWSFAHNCMAAPLAEFLDI